MLFVKNKIKIVDNKKKEESHLERQEGEEMMTEFISSNFPTV